MSLQATDWYNGNLKATMVKLDKMAGLSYSRELVTHIIAVIIRL
jgi:hypothetical protein